MPFVKAAKKSIPELTITAGTGAIAAHSAFVALFLYCFIGWLCTIAHRKTGAPLLRLISRHNPGMAGREWDFKDTIWGVILNPLRFVATSLTMANGLKATGWSGELYMFLTSSKGCLMNYLRVPSFVTLIASCWLLVNAKRAVTRAMRAMVNADDSLRNEKRSKALANINSIDFLGNCLVALACLALGSEMGLPLKSVWAGLGFTSIAIGLAVRDIAGNLISGLQLITYQPFTTGDSIIVKGREGTVRRIGLLVSEMMTEDKEYLYMPNALLTNQVVVNLTRAPSRPLEMQFVVTSTDMDAVKGVTADIRKLLKGHPAISPVGDKHAYIASITKDGPQMAIVTDIRDKSANEYLAAKEDLLCSIYALLNERGLALAK